MYSELKVLYYMVLYYEDAVEFQHVYAYGSKTYRKTEFTVTIRQSLVENLACI